MLIFDKEKEEMKQTNEQPCVEPWIVLLLWVLAITAFGFAFFDHLDRVDNPPQPEFIMEGETKEVIQAESMVVPVPSPARVTKSIPAKSEEEKRWNKSGYSLDEGSQLSFTTQPQTK